MQPIFPISSTTNFRLNYLPLNLNQQNLTFYIHKSSHKKADFSFSHSKKPTAKFAAFLLLIVTPIWEFIIFWLLVDI